MEFTKAPNIIFGGVSRKPRKFRHPHSSSTTFGDMCPKPAILWGCILIRKPVMSRLVIVGTGNAGVDKTIFIKGYQCAIRSL